MSKESAAQYFSQKSGIMLWLVGIIGLCMVFVGYAGERRSVIFMAVGAVLMFLCLYELLHSRNHKKKGAELDRMAEETAAMRSLYGSALKQLCLSGDDVEGYDTVSLTGYTTSPIQTRPYFRRDESDGLLRSSNYQTSLLLFGPNRFYTYTYVFSLVDKEHLESGRLWRYSEVAEARVVREDFTYLIGTQDEKRETSPVRYLLLKDTDGHSFLFFFDHDPDGAERAESVLGHIAQGGSAQDSPAEIEDTPPDLTPPGPPSAARGRDLELGVIGEHMQNPRR